MRDDEAAQTGELEIDQNKNFTYMARGVHRSTAASSPPGPTTHQLVATDYSGGCLGYCLHRTNRTVVVSTEEHAFCQ